MKITLGCVKARTNGEPRKKQNASIYRLTSAAPARPEVGGRKAEHKRGGFVQLAGNTVNHAFNAMIKIPSMKNFKRELGDFPKKSLKKRVFLKKSAFSPKNARPAQRENVKMRTFRVLDERAGGKGKMPENESRSGERCDGFKGILLQAGLALSGGMVTINGSIRVYHIFFL